jgi:hypothetical protein
MCQRNFYDYEFIFNTDLRLRSAIFHLETYCFDGITKSLEILSSAIKNIIHSIS